MRSTILATLAALTALSPAVSAQTRFTFVPSLSIAGIYDDNLFAQENGSAGKMLQVRPTVEGSYESPRLRFLSLYSQDMLRSNFSTLNTVDARRHAYLDTEFRTSPLTSFGVVGRYDRSETPGEIDLDTGILGTRRTAQRWQLSPTLVRRLNPRSVITAGYDLTRENELDTPSGTLHQARVALSREFTSRSAVVGTYLARYFVDPLGESTSHSVLAGWTREMAPHTHLSLYAGPRVSSYQSGVKPEVSASLRRDTNRFDVRADYWHGETIILGIEGPVAVDSGSLRIAWPFRSRWEFGTHLGATDIDTIDFREARVYRSTLLASWTSRGMYSVSASYGVDYQQGDIRRRLDDNVLRHVFRVSFTVAPRLFRSILPPDEAARVKGVIR
ncbi:MAG TPA: hypothetical protein VM819_02360 [Vicinamibacterales bacterium]|nr:hypothetical protein [Vicinamibacterales bacterium]